MARPVRIEFAGALYHVMARGNQRQIIFGDDKDYRRFPETLGEACQKTGWRIRPCVLMANHGNSARAGLIEIGESPCSRIVGAVIRGNWKRS